MTSAPSAPSALSTSSAPTGSASAAASAARHLRVVGHAGAAPREADGTSRAAPLVGYLLLVPEGTDPRELLSGENAAAELRPLAAPPASSAATPAPSPSPSPSGPRTPVEPEPGPAPSAPPAQPSGVRIDPVQHTAEADGRQLDLTYLEFELLAHFLAHPQRVHTRDQLVGTLWGYSHVGDGRTVDVHIARLRRKLGPDHRGRIVTVRRVGYKYVPGPGDGAAS